MPELPEVEITTRNLGRWTAGRSVVRVELPDPAVVRARRSTSPSAAVADPSVTRAWLGPCGAPRRRGKRIGWPLGAGAVIVHLGMTGHWVRRQGGGERHARLGLVLDDGWILWFTDARRFGCVVPVDPAEVDRALAEGLGPDAWTDRPDGPTLAAALSARIPIKVVLLDQQRLAGLGNIHAAEALWRAQVAPTRMASSLSPEEWARLAEGIHAQLAFALDVTQAEEVLYLSDGAENPFVVYERPGQPCPRCGVPISRLVQRGRSTWHCAGCQR